VHSKVVDSGLEEGDGSGTGAKNIVGTGRDGDIDVVGIVVSEPESLDSIINSEAHAKRADAGTGGGSRGGLRGD
jgi:hypothetical protein